MITFAIRFLLLLVLSSTVSAQISPQADAIDCRKTCGTKTCCIAQATTIPVCAISRNATFDSFLASPTRQRIDEIVKRCSNPASGAEGLRGLLAEKEDYGRVAEFSCHWGCCSARVVAMHGQEPSDH
jgi:hypothetical protein